MSGPQNPDAGWRALTLHQEAMTLQALVHRLATTYPEAADIARPLIQAEIAKERATWKKTSNPTPSTTSSASAPRSPRVKQTT